MADALAVVRDISIILIALLDIAILAVLALLAYLALKLFLKLKSATPDLLELSKSTLTEIKGTTDFVSNTVVTPLIRITALASAASRFVAVLFGGQRRRI